MTNIALVIAMVALLMIFFFWLAYGSPNGGRWPHRS